ncbi:MAG TPA: hypothetical protein G4O12_00280 [Dehalococcoidia bacterium]|nr:hypothetical protein [Dehalococcoidia bacterium]
MSKVAIITDSTAGLPAQLVERYGIRIVTNVVIYRILQRHR